jgi:hypothetical protein
MEEFEQPKHLLFIKMMRNPAGVIAAICTSSSRLYCDNVTPNENPTSLDEETPLVSTPSDSHTVELEESAFTNFGSALQTGETLCTAT